MGWWRALLLAASLSATSAWSSESESPIHWGRDLAAGLAQARSEDKPVLLYLEAVWCHWCHVMDQRTYGDEAVQALVLDRYVPVRLDQDAHPDLSTRYRRWGWPATIILDGEGNDLAKRQGFVAPENFARLLARIADDPTPEAGDEGQQAAAPPLAADQLSQRLQANHLRSHDAKLGGLNSNQKYVDRDTVEWDLTLANSGDASAAERARRTLSNALALLDPAWGGFYQYSTHRDWNHPHFEKRTELQADYLRIYTLGWAQLGDPAYLQAARATAAYARRFLAAPDGGYYPSQDADLRPGEHAEEYFALGDAERVALGIPRVAPQRFARESAAMVEALATLAEYSGDRLALSEADRGGRWLLAERRLPEGGYRHGADTDDRLHLDVQIRAGRAFLALYRATSQRAWLSEAIAVAEQIEKLRADDAGYYSIPPAQSALAPVRDLAAQISLARFSALLAHYSGQEIHRQMADHALHWLRKPDVAFASFTEPGILLALGERARDPLHVTIVGPREEALSAQLYAAGSQLPGWYKRLEWWDRAEGPLPNPDIAYPPSRKPAAFVCTERRCSVPLRSADALRDFLNENPQSGP